MNSYKITYVAGEGETEQTYITERTEAAARKFFKKASGGREIVDVELYDTEASATKEQERETLEKIKTMVAELGPKSYLATAFEGVFEDAEQNIEDDAAYSMKARLEIQAQRAIERGYEVDQLKADLAAARSDVEVLRGQLDHAQGQVDALKRQQLPVWLHSAVYGLASKEIATSKARMEQAAETMAYYAEALQDIAFTEAVKSYRAAKERREVCEQIIKGLEALTEE